MEKIFEVNNLIGKGNFGRVFKMTDSLGRVYAVKKVNKESLSDASAEYLKKEIKIQSEIFHHNIVNCLFSFETETSVYIAQEFCAGGDLESYVFRTKKIPKPFIRKLVTGLLGGLTYLHRNNIMHRDLKLANLLLTTSNPDTAELKLADFGFAKKMEQSITTTQVGSPLYMAPEIFRDSNYSIKADMWSLGAVLYEIFTGQALFSVSSLEELISKQEVPVCFPENSRLPLACKNLIQSLLQKNPESRPSCEEIWVNEYFSEVFIENEKFFEDNEENYEFFDEDLDTAQDKAADNEVDVNKSEYFEDFEENNFILVNAEIEVAVIQDLLQANEEGKSISALLNKMVERLCWHKENIEKEFGRLIEFDQNIQKSLERIRIVLDKIKNVGQDHGSRVGIIEESEFRKFTLSLLMNN